MLSRDALMRIRLYRQHLTGKADKHTVCRDLNGLQAQFTVNVEHALKIRCSEPIVKDAFGGGLVKNWTIRGTVHVFNQDDLPVYKYHDENNPYRSHDWRNAVIIGQRPGQCGPDRLEYIAKLIIDRVSGGITTRDGLKDACRAAGVTEDEAAVVFCPWGGLLRALCERGLRLQGAGEEGVYALPALCAHGQRPGGIGTGGTILHACRPRHA